VLAGCVSAWILADASLQRRELAVESGSPKASTAVETAVCVSSVCHAELPSRKRSNTKDLWRGGRDSNRQLRTQVARNIAAGAPGSHWLVEPTHGSQDHCGSQLATIVGMGMASIVREARRRAGLTQAALAERAGVPKSTVARIESGARTPSAELVERLVRAAGFELTPSLSEPDPETDSMFERTLRRTPAQRLADATRTARFVLRGRREVEAATDG
jgi:transcriptional regulator with XRE-family HTH domain